MYVLQNEFFDETYILETTWNTLFQDSSDIGMRLYIGFVVIVSHGSTVQSS
jgi:hypothetical protein